MTKCKKCNDDHYILNGCCDGRECGCQAQPVSMTNCDLCNPLGDKQIGDGVKEYSEFIEYIGVKHVGNKR